MGRRALGPSSRRGWHSGPGQRLSLLLKSHPGLDLLVVEKLNGPGQGDTARSAAAFRDMFSSPVNRQLSQGSIAFYERLETESHRIGLKKIGYLWLAAAGQMAAWRQALTHMAEAGVAFQVLDGPDLAARLPELNPRDISHGIFGRNCGSLDPARLTKFYEQEVLRLGGRVRLPPEGDPASNGTAGGVSTEFG